jgi:hypothetical protein
MKIEDQQANFVKYAPTPGMQDDANKIFLLPIDISRNNN